MSVVSNTSPITNLAGIGQLDLLRQLYDTITIPQAVYNEMATSAELYQAHLKCKRSPGSQFNP